MGGPLVQHVHCVFFSGPVWCLPEGQGIFDVKRCRAPEHQKQERLLALRPVVLAKHARNSVDTTKYGGFGFRSLLIFRFVS